MKSILKRKRKLIIALVFLIVIVLALCIAYESIFSNNSGKYGNRLEGIEKVDVKTKQKNEIKKNIESLEISTSVKVYLTGKIVKAVVVVKDDVDLGKAKESYNKLMEKLSDEQKKYFDVQVFLKKKGKDDNFPTIGYKHHAKENVSWTKGR
jgi:flagellar basal body-associated protein FliL